MFKNLSIKAKLYVLMSVSILALILVSGKSIYGDITDTCSCSALKDGVVLSTKISALLHETQKERGATAGFLGSKGKKFKQTLSNQRELTNKRIKEIDKDKVLLPLHFMFEPKLWNALNGRWVVLLLKRYGYYSPCIGCHAYLRIIRIPLARHLGNKIISGERLYHNGDFKIDQIEEVLNVYSKICRDFDVELILPIRYIKEGKKIKEIIGEEWEQGEKQFSCVFSGNYRDKDGKVIFEKIGILKLLNEFIYPASIEILKEGYKGNFNYLNIVKKII